MPFVRSDRKTAAGVVLLAVAAALAGCASKNPLIDEPAPAAKAPSAPAPATAAPVAATATATATATDSAPAAPATASRAEPPASSNNGNNGVVTTGPTGIQRFLGFLSPYKIDIQQGNFVSREMIAQLKEGIQRPGGVTPEQVRFALGTPLVTDIFHDERWDYVFRLKKRNGEVISSRVTVHFKDNRLAAIDGGDSLPTEQEYLSYIADRK
ncbi:MAG TPA: outer membrane protein assembly factor BamE [Noviherbaspirillum sp.]